MAKCLTKPWKLMGSVCDTAQSFLGLGNGPQVLHSTPNKRCSDPNDTFHPNAFSGRFSFSEATHASWTKEHGTFNSGTVVIAKCPIPAPFTCHRMPPRSGLMILFATLTTCQLLFDVRLVLRTETLLCSLVHNFNTALSKVRIFTKRTCLTVSFAAATAGENPRFLCKSL